MDGVASALFDAITRLPEYYLTRREREILAARGGCRGADTLVELGSGTSEKTRLLRDALALEGRLRLFVPLDVDEQTLRRSAAALLEEYRGVEVHAVVADFEGDLSLLPGVERRLLAFLGSRIGNLPPDRRRAFLLDAATSLRAGDWFLLGFDLVKARLASYAPTTTRLVSRRSSSRQLFVGFRCARS